MLSKSNRKAFLLGIALSHTSNYDHIAKACNLVEMHVMTWVKVFGLNWGILFLVRS